jgi:hypothetical protein
MRPLTIRDVTLEFTKGVFNNPFFESIIPVMPK